MNENSQRFWMFFWRGRDEIGGGSFALLLILSKRYALDDRRNKSSDSRALSLDKISLMRGENLVQGSR